MATGLEAVLLWMLMSRRLQGLQGGRIFQGAWQALLGAGVMGLALCAWLSQAGTAPIWVLVFGGVLIGGAVYGGMLLLLRVDELRSLIHMLRKRLGRVRG